MDINDEIIYDAPNFIRIYKSGRVERFLGTEFIPPSTDPITGVSSKDTLISPSIPARLYIPKVDSSKKLPILIHYHGGAFCLGSAFEPPLHNYLNSLVSKVNVIVVSVQYRLAPEYPIPVAYEDSYAALDWVISHRNEGDHDPWIINHGDFDRVFVSGESAGANIAHHVAMYGGAKIRGAILIHPFFLSPDKVESEEHDPVITEKLESIWKLFCPTKLHLNDPWINPLASGSLPLINLGCEGVLVLVGGVDTLRDRGRIYYEKLKESGWKGDANIWEAAGEGHCFHLWKPGTKIAKAQDKMICEFLTKF
ncbi:hypothetical protein LUZ60_002707 [Juncus effusus]|nr:hypothetical protein LUZ60_002707 [Juncus effusus]